MGKLIKATLIVSAIRLLDMITTFIGIKRLGIEAEGNKLIHLEIELFNNVFLGLLMHYIITILLTYLLFLEIDYINRKWNKGNKDLFKFGFILSVVLFSLIPIWNLINIYLL